MSTWMATLAASRTCSEGATRRMRTRCSVSSVTSNACCPFASRGGGAACRETRAGSTAPTMPRHSAHACWPFLSLMLCACRALNLLSNRSSETVAADNSTLIEVDALP